MPTAQPLLASDPREVGGYELAGRLGAGGQGTVYLGLSPAGGRVAVKLLHRGFAADSQARRHFERELAAARRVAAFCTARVLAADPDADMPYLVSEFVAGPSLREVIAERGPLAGDELRRLAIGMATALAAIHQADVVHRDFKPGNVLIGPEGPRVIDFGIARPLDATTGTLSGAIGTPSYMAPEQLAGARAAPPLDMFAWACTLAYAANGRPPFGTDTIPAVMHRIVNDPPDLGGLAGELRALAAECLAKDPARRPSATGVLVRLLGEAADPLTEGTAAAATLGSGFPRPEPTPFVPPGAAPEPAPYPPPGAAPEAAPYPSPDATPEPAPYPSPGAASEPAPFVRPGIASEAAPFVPPDSFPRAAASPVPPVPPDAAVSPPPAATTVPARDGRRGRTAALLAVAAGVPAVALVATLTFLAVKVLTGDDGGRKPSPNGTGQTAAANGPCGYRTDGAAGGRSVGLPPARPRHAGTVRAKLSTWLGTVQMDLDATRAPCTVNSIAHLAGNRFYDGTHCHRLTTTAQLKVLQCGDPTGQGSGGPGYRFATENVRDARYPRGTVAMAHAADPDTNGSQFFISYGEAKIPPTYTVVGRVTSGMSIIDQVARGGVKDLNGPGDGAPKTDFAIQTLRLTPG